MVKRQRDNTPPTSDDEEPQPKLVIIQTQRAQMMKMILDHHQGKEEL